MRERELEREREKVRERERDRETERSEQPASSKPRGSVSEETVMKRKASLRFAGLAPGWISEMRALDRLCLLVQYHLGF